MKWLPAVGFVVLLASGSLPVVARGDTPPSVWDIAKDPLERKWWARHVEVQQLLQPEVDSGGFVEAARDRQEVRLSAELATLEAEDAAHSPDVRLRFDLGIVAYELGYLQARADLFERAVEVLVPALERAPDHPAATEAMERLVYCYVRLNRPEDELATWHRYVPRLSDDRARAVAMMNMGEAEMRLGRVEDALETFREVGRIVATLPNSTPTYVLNEWDLAVALDRSGDSRGATDEASRVLGMSIFAAGMPLPMPTSRALRGTLILRSPGVFFVPKWEVEWYFALAAAADARDAPDAREASESWAEAESHWKNYVDQSSKASTEHDPWLAIARVRLAHARAERLASEARARGAAKRAPAPPNPAGPRSILVH